MGKEKYADWAELMERFGYSWEPHTVVTDDGWSLTVFRITGKIKAVKMQN